MRSIILNNFSVSKLLRIFDPKEAASASQECFRDLVANGQCDWQIQNNANGICNYDRTDCKESKECLEIPVVLETKGDSEKCEKVREFLTLLFQHFHILLNYYRQYFGLICIRSVSCKEVIFVEIHRKKFTTVF